MIYLSEKMRNGFPLYICPGTLMQSLDSSEIHRNLSFANQELQSFWQTVSICLRCSF